MTETQYDQETIHEVALLVRRSWPALPNEKATYTENQLIEAWHTGLTDAFRHYNDTLKRVLEENIRYVAATRDHLVKFIRDEQLTVNRVYLNVEAYDTLRILVALPEADYCSEAFLNVLSEASNREEQALEESTLNLSIDFVPDSGDLDEEQLLSDGYIWPQILTPA